MKSLLKEVFCPPVRRVFCGLNLTLVTAAFLAVGLPLSADAQGTPAFTNLWSLSPGDRYDLGTERRQRGVAINPVTTNVLYTSYNDGGSNHVTIVSGADGTLVNTLPPEDEFGIAQIAGVVPLSQVGVSDDGVVYACGVTLDYGGSPFLIYRWEDEMATNLTIA